MFGTYFYHQRIRKSVALFGSLFNNLHVIRKDAAGTSVISTQKVPLSYAPKNKFLARIREVADLDKDQLTAIKLPRMSFEIVSIAYDSPRQLPRNNKVSLAQNVAGKRSTVYTPVPYILTFSLNIFTKTQDDALQIVEQIIPYFAPAYTLTIKPFGDFADVVEDVPITLQSIVWSDDYEGPQESRRTIMYTLDFEMKISFSGPITDGAAVITKAITEFHNDTDTTNELSHSRIIIQPDPLDSSADDDYGFTITHDIT